jgi:hypothetical protein
VSGAARQRAYRERQKAAGRDSIQIWLDSAGHAQLKHLCDGMDIDRSAVIAKALALLAEHQPEREAAVSRPVHRRRRQAYAGA